MNMEEIYIDRKCTECKSKKWIHMFNNVYACAMCSNELVDLEKNQEIQV